MDVKFGPCAADASSTSKLGPRTAEAEYEFGFTISARFGLQEPGSVASTSFSGVASLNFNRVASFFDDGLHMVSTIKSGLRVASSTLGLRVASSHLHQVASLNSHRVASPQFGLGVASPSDGSMVGSPPAFYGSGRILVASTSFQL